MNVGKRHWTESVLLCVAALSGFLAAITTSRAAGQCDKRTCKNIQGYKICAFGTYWYYDKPDCAFCEGLHNWCAGGDPDYMMCTYSDPTENVRGAPAATVVETCTCPNSGVGNTVQAPTTKGEADYDSQRRRRVCP